MGQRERVSLCRLFQQSKWDPCTGRDGKKRVPVQLGKRLATVQDSAQGIENLPPGRRRVLGGGRIPSVTS